MKKINFILGTIVIAAISSAIAINANAKKRAFANLWTFTTGQMKRVPCATTTTQPHTCAISVPLYTNDGNQYKGRAIDCDL